MTSKEIRKTMGSPCFFLEGGGLGHQTGKKSSPFHPATRNAAKCSNLTNYMNHTIRGSGSRIVHGLVKSFPRFTWRVPSLKLAPENWWFEDYFPFGMPSCQVLCYFQGVYFIPDIKYENKVLVLILFFKSSQKAAIPGLFSDARTCAS